MTAFAALAAAGGLTSFVGNYRSANMTQSLGKLNYGLEMRRARAIKRQGVEAAGQHMLQIGHLIDQQRVGLASAGVSVETGSALELQAEAARIGSLDAATIRYNSAMAAWGVRAQATLNQFASREGSKAQKLGAFGGLIGSGAQAAALGSGG